MCGQFFLFIKNVKHYSRPTMTIAICGLRFFYKDTLNRSWTIFGIVRPAPEKKLPVILSVAEVRQILSRLRLPRYQACLSTIYSCGLRLQEGTNLRVADIDSGRMMIHVRHGKGAKDRYVPLPQRTLELLRDYWKTHRHPGLLFPAEGRNHGKLAQAIEPMSKRSVQQARQLLAPAGQNSALLTATQPSPIRNSQSPIRNSPCCPRCRGPLTLLSPLAPRGRPP